jgi:hypothetical protein
MPNHNDQVDEADTIRGPVHVLDDSKQSDECGEAHETKPNHVDLVDEADAIRKPVHVLEQSDECGGTHEAMLNHDDQVDDADRISGPVHVRDDQAQNDEPVMHHEHSNEPTVDREARNELAIDPEPIHDHFQPRIIDVSPSRHYHFHVQHIEHDPTLEPIPDENVREPEKPRHTEPAPEPIPEELAGIGQHSTLEHSNFPQGVLDDDLTTDMQ